LIKPYPALGRVGGKKEMTMYDYNYTSTKNLEALKRKKERAMQRVYEQWGTLSWGFEQMKRWQDQLRHINAVLTARYTTMALWDDK